VYYLDKKKKKKKKQKKKKKKTKNPLLVEKRTLFSKGKSEDIFRGASSPKGAALLCSDKEPSLTPSCKTEKNVLKKREGTSVSGIPSRERRGKRLLAQEARKEAVCERLTVVMREEGRGGNPTKPKKRKLLVRGGDTALSAPLLIGEEHIHSSATEGEDVEEKRGKGETSTREKEGGMLNP